MTSDKPNFPWVEPFRRYVPLAVWAIVVLVILLIPLKIISYGYLPGDDALRHAAKAVSGKPWSEILVLDPVYKMDHEFGWNWLLEKIHIWEQWDAETLVIFSVVTLFFLVNAAALPWLKRPEAWLVTLLATMVLSYIPQRFMLGRPYLVTIASLFTVLLLWRTQGASPPKKPAMLLLVALAAVCTFVHGVWYLWALPVAAFFFAREFRWGITLGVCWAVGIVIGSALTAHPVAYLLQALQLAHLAVGEHATQRTMAVELQPFTGDFMALTAVGGLLILRHLAKLDSVRLTRDPAFWLVCFCWALGFKVGRFWDDWGWPALMILIASDLQLLLQARFAPDSFKRLGLALALAAVTFLAVTCDFSSRWTQNLTQQYLTTDNPDLKGWMPGKGGIFYTADMTLFYQTFFKNPRGDWRYMLGFEPTWMPKEDFEIYHKILWNYFDDKAYGPWVQKMKPADRLAIRGGRGAPPGIPQLEWNYGVTGIWIGRLPRPVETGTAPPTVPATATNSISLPRSAK